MKLLLLAILCIAAVSCNDFIIIPLRESKLERSIHNSESLIVKNDPMYVADLETHSPTKNLQANVKLGNSNAFNMELDTYSGYSWVYGKETDHKVKYECKDSCQFIKDAQSLALVNQGTPGSILSTQNSISGLLATDKLTINKATITNFPLVITTKVVANVNRNSDGVLSLGYQKNNGLLYELKKQKKINKEIFSIYLGDEKKFLTLGDHEKYLTTDKLVNFTKGVKDDRWALDVANMHFNSTLKTNLLPATSVAYFDFANEGIYVPRGSLVGVKDALIQNFSSTTACKVVENSIECDCTLIDKFPKLDIAFQNGDKKEWLSIAGKYLISKVGTVCKTAFYEGVATQDVMIGRVIAEDHVLIFNQEESKISIGKEYSTSIESHKISEDIMGTVIGVGIFFIIASIIALVVILKPVESSPAMSKVSLR